MLFWQVAHMNSLREVCLRLAGCKSPLKHLGISSVPKKSTLAYANANRPWELYESIFMQLLDKCQTETAAHSRRKFRFKNKQMSPDDSIIELSAAMFDWAKYLQRKGAIKLHLLLDHDGYLPSFGVVTDGKFSELKVARSLNLEAGTILAIDRGYNDYEWFGQLTRDGVLFVTRMKTNTVYTTVGVCTVPEKGNILSDQIVSPPSLDKAGEEPVLFRRIECWNADKQQILVFFTNLLHLAASTVAAIYKDSRQIELFFKALEQTAKVKSFLGTSAKWGQDADLDGADRHADLEIPADEIQLRLVAFQSGGTAAPATVHFQRLVGMTEQSAGGAASRKATGRTVAHAADLVDICWTAEEMQTPT
jgi:Transposase DDE domain